MSVSLPALALNGRSSFRLREETMKKKLLLTAVILGGVVVLPIRAMDTTPAVTIYMDYDPSIPTFVVRLAKRQASRIFAKIGTPVQFRYGRKAQTVGQSSLELDMYIVMQAPARIPSDTFGISQPYPPGRSNRGVLFTNPELYARVVPEYGARLYHGSRDRARARPGPLVRFG